MLRWLVPLLAALPQGWMGAKGINIAQSSSSDPPPDFLVETWEVTGGGGEREFGQAQVCPLQQRECFCSPRGRGKVLREPTIELVSVQNRRDLSVYFKRGYHWLCSFHVSLLNVNIFYL